MKSEVKDVLVSVVMITYGHEKFIKEAIDGVLMQECDFQYELIIANDCSPDDTDRIVLNIISKTEKANRIKYVRHTVNKGMNENFLWALHQVRGKYVALCEGDDYWTDPFKLQKQVNYLEKYNDVGLCYTDFNALDTINKLTHNSVFKNSIEPFYQSKSFEDHLLRKGYLAPMTWVFRKDLIKYFPREGFVDASFAIALDVFKNSNIVFLPLVTAVYRMHIGSASRPKSIEQVFKRHKGVFDTQLHYIKKYKVDDKILELKIKLNSYIELLPFSLQLNDNDFTEKAIDDLQNLGINIKPLFNMAFDSIRISRSRAYRLGRILLKPIKIIWSIFK